MISSSFFFVFLFPIIRSPFDGLFMLSVLFSVGRFPLGAVSS
jgi:hypothetical protein